MPEHWVNNRKTEEKKMHDLLTEVPWISLLHVGVHQRVSWHARTSFPTRKVPERKNLCLKTAAL